MSVEPRESALYSSRTRLRREVAQALRELWTSELRATAGSIERGAAPRLRALAQALELGLSAYRVSILRTSPDASRGLSLVKIREAVSDLDRQLSRTSTALERHKDCKSVQTQRTLSVAQARLERVTIELHDWFNELTLFDSGLPGARPLPATRTAPASPKPASVLATVAAQAGASAAKAIERPAPSTKAPTQSKPATARHPADAAPSPTPPKPASPEPEPEPEPEPRAISWSPLPWSHFTPLLNGGDLTMGSDVLIHSESNPSTIESTPRSPRKLSWSPGSPPPQLPAPATEQLPRWHSVQVAQWLVHSDDDLSHI